MAELLLADLHLPPRSSGQTADGASPYREAFLRFCLGPARKATQVFILGDLFEYWIGDDVSLAEYPEEIAALKALSNSGVKVQVQVGNRDFMLGNGFARATGATLLKDEVVVPLAGIPTLLAHGDSYCTDDVKYQQWRSFSRNPIAQWGYLRLSPERRRKIAGGLRNDDNKRGKAEGIMDVNAQAITAAFQRHGVTRLIHGHTHRPTTHLLSVDGRACERIVLPDWRAERMEWLKADAEGLSLRGFS